jgi:hypothetical protein
MKGVHLLGVAALAACATRPANGDDVYRAQAAATFSSLECSQRAVGDLGYRVTWYDGGPDGALRAERVFNEGPQASRGYLTVSVPRDPGTMMYVTGERITESSRMPIPTNPGPRTGGGPTPTPTPVPTARRTGPRRVSPGPVASDARHLVRRCGIGGTELG